jgi:type IV secretion system protein VirB6
MAFAAELEKLIDASLMTYVSSTSRAMTAYVVPLAVTANTLYLTNTAYAIARGDVNEPMMKLLKDVVLMVLVAAIAFSVGNYQNLVVQGANALMSDLISVVSLGDAKSIGELLDSLFTGCITPPGDGVCRSYSTVMWFLALKNSNAIGIPDASYMWGQFCVAVGQACIVLGSLIPLILSKCALAIFLAIGPIFILGLMWPVTKKYFESWLSATLGNVLTLVLIAAICSIFPTVVKKFVQDAFSGSLIEADEILQRMDTLLIICIALAVTALHASQKAAHLSGGGVAMDGRGLGGMFAQAMVNKLLMNRNNDPKNDDGNGGKNKKDDTNSAAKHSLAERAKYATGNFSGKQVRNVLDALDKKR